MTDWELIFYMCFAGLLFSTAFPGDVDGTDINYDLGYSEGQLSYETNPAMVETASVFLDNYDYVFYTEFDIIIDKYVNHDYIDESETTDMLRYHYCRGVLDGYNDAARDDKKQSTYDTLNENMNIDRREL